MPFRFPWTPSVSTEVKASKAGRLISLFNAGRAVWTPRQYDDLAKESYSKNAVAFRAIHEIAKCAASVPFVLFKDVKKTEQIEQHPLLDLLARPNPLQSRQEFIASVVGFYLIAGNSYLESVGPLSSGKTKELWSLRPDRMQVKAGKKGIPLAFIYAVGGQRKEWPVSQRDGISKVLHWKSFNPLDDWYGMSPVQAAADSIDQHNQANDWNMSLLQNAARPSGALVVDPKLGVGLDDAQYARLQSEIDDKYGGHAKAGRPMLLEGGLDWKEMSLSPQDMDWLNGKHTSARDIAMVFGMPSQMLGIPGDNTHRNMEEARLWLWEQTIIPMLETLLSELNWWLTPRFGKDLHLFMDYDEIPALITRRHVLWDKITKSDFLTINEKRKAVGYEERPEGDIILVPLNKQPAENAVAVDEEDDEEPEEENNKKKPDTEEQKELRAV